MARDRVLVAIGPDEQAEQVVRAGKRIADALDAQWTVVYVETPELLRLSAAERNRRIDLLRLAESLGAETVTLDGPSAAQALLEYARTRNATRLVDRCAQASRLARLAAAVDDDRARAQGARLRRHHDRRRGQARRSGRSGVDRALTAESGAADPLGALRVGAGDHG